MLFRSAVRYWKMPLNLEKPKNTEAVYLVRPEAYNLVRQIEAKAINVFFGGR